MNYGEIIIYKSLVFKCMFETFIFKGNLRRTLTYQAIITLFNLTHMISVFDLVTIDMETPRIDSGCSLKNKFIELIDINP